MNKTSFLSGIFTRVPIEDQVLLARHLAVMAKAGLPLLESVKMIQKETKSKSLKKILDQVVVDVSNGQFLSASLEKHKNVFGNLFINIIRVGESAGILAENLNYLADELKKKRELKKKVTGALIYPAVIFVATFGITGLLTVFIFPKILPIFKSLNVELPITTRILIWLSNALTNYGLYLILGLLALLLGIYGISLIQKVRYFLHWVLLKLPIFGNISRSVNLANASRTLGLTLKSGVRVVEAATITAESLTNLVYQRELLKAADLVQRGEALGPILEKHPKLFPSIVTQMVAVGEASGNLSETLLYLSDFYEGEVNEITKNLSNVLEPILMVTMGIVVGFVAISIITPIYEITSSISPR